MYKLLVLVLSQYPYTTFSIVSSSPGITELSLLLGTTSPPPLPWLVLSGGSPGVMRPWFPPALAASTLARTATNEVRWPALWVDSMANIACFLASFAFAIGVMPQQWAIPPQVTMIRMIMAATAKYPTPPSKSNKKNAV